MDDNKPSTSVWDSYRRAGDRFGGENAIQETPIRIRNTLHNAASVEPLMERNVNFLSEKSQAVILDEYAKQFHRLSEENRKLREQVSQQQKQIRNLERIVKALQSDVDSSESRYDRSTSTNSSSVPIHRVTPQKRDPRSPRSPRNIRSGIGASRRLSFDTNERTPQTTPSRGYLRSRQILRDAGIDSDILLTSSSQSTPRVAPLPNPTPSTVPRTTNTSLRALSDVRDTLSAPMRSSFGSSTRTITPVGQLTRVATTLPRPSTNHMQRDTTTRDDSQQELITPTRSAPSNRTFTRSEPRNPNVSRAEVPVPQPQVRISNGVRREIMMLSSMSSSTTTLADPPEEDTNTPGYYLRTMRPGFIRDLENRKRRVKEAASERKLIEEQKKNAAKGLATGAFKMDQVLDVLMADSSKVTAFSPRTMKESTRRRLSRTNEFTRAEQEKQKQIDAAANKIVTLCYNLKTQMRLKSRTRSMPSINTFNR